LSQSKILGEDIQEKQKVAEVTEGIIDTTRNSYVQVAVTATILYFCVAGSNNQILINFQIIFKTIYILIIYYTHIYNSLQKLI